MANSLTTFGVLGLAQYIMQHGGYKGVAKSKYVNDKQITDHYAIIPTGQGLGNLNGLNEIQKKVYDIHHLVVYPM